jgi:uncharacterized membrane protein
MPPNKPNVPQRRQNQPAQISVTQSYEGPIPPPSVLEGYERVSPGAAKQILQWAEEEANHRRAMERGVLEFSSRDQASAAKEAKLGQIFGFTIGLFAIACGSWVAIQGQPAAGAAIGGLPVAGLVAVFIIGRRRDRAQAEQDKSDEAAE